MGLLISLGRLHAISEDDESLKQMAYRYDDIFLMDLCRILSNTGCSINN